MKKVLGVAVIGVWLVVATVGSADVFNMGTGLTSLETVPVGNANNAADTRYGGYGSVGYDYLIGKYEVTAGQYTEFINKVAGVDTYGLYCTDMWTDTYGCKIERFAGSGTTGDPYQYRVASDWANRPVNCVSWGDAARFANWLQNNQPIGAQDLSTTEDGAYYLNGATSYAALMAVKRKATWKWAITSENEWYKAAYYKDGSTNAGYFDYPTSSNSIDTSKANYNASVVHTTDVGSYAASSPYGTFDQGGNVWEWNESIYYNDSYRGLRGGSFFYTASSLHASNRSDFYPMTESSDFGFRVSEVPEPASIALLALGGMALFRQRKA